MGKTAYSARKLYLILAGVWCDILATLCFPIFLFIFHFCKIFYISLSTITYLPVTQHAEFIWAGKTHVFRYFELGRYFDYGQRGILSLCSTKKKATTEKYFTKSRVFLLKSLHYTDAILQRCFYKKVFPKFAAYSQQNTQAEVWLQ